MDTNAFISGFILPNSVPGQALTKAAATSVLLISRTTLEELATVIRRPKFDKYFSRRRRSEFVEEVEDRAELVDIVTPIRVCRDPSDDKFLEVAVNGAADVIVTGDWDLLALNPFQGIAILTSADFLAWASP